MRKRILFLWIALFSIVQTAVFSCTENSTERKPLAIWVRAYGNPAKEEINSYLVRTADQLSPHFDTTIMLCTNPDDPVLEAIQTLPENFPIKPVFANMRSFQQSLNQLTTETPPSTPVLLLSVGLDIEPRLLIDALEWMHAGAYTVGWTIESLGNDGTLPGKGWYNTAALYSPDCIQWLKEHPFPVWVDNGVEGSLLIEDRIVPIGGNEEIWLMGALYSEQPQAFSVLNTKDILHFSNRTGTDIDFDAKMKRKTLVSDYYLEKKLNLTHRALWSRLVILQKDGSTFSGADLFEAERACE